MDVFVSGRRPFSCFLFSTVPHPTPFLFRFRFFASTAVPFLVQLSPYPTTFLFHVYRSFSSTAGLSPVSSYTRHLFLSVVFTSLFPLQDEKGSVRVVDKPQYVFHGLLFSRTGYECGLRRFHRNCVAEASHFLYFLFFLSVEVFLLFLSLIRWYVRPSFFCYFFFFS